MSTTAAFLDPYVTDWLNLLIRWLHAIAAIAWIGASFYFVLLDQSLEEPKSAEDRRDGVGGELWEVHGGGAPERVLAPGEELDEARSALEELCELVGRQLPR